MAYLGGKSKGAEHILDVLNSPLFDSYDYIEPFCGYCHILRRVVKKRSYKASDNNELLLVLLKHIQETKNQHPTITREEYAKLRQNPNSNKLRAAYAAFCYSYNGKYFGGFTESYQGRFYPAERKKYYDSLHDNDTIKHTSFSYNDYTKYMNVHNKLIYCDPPYANTTEYHSTFDSTLFWENMRKLSKTNYVFISEYTAPSDFICITKTKKYNSLSGRGATRKRVEKLFVHSSKLSDPKIKSIFKTSKFRCTRKA
jgi:DNA adenine methylase